MENNALAHYGIRGQKWGVRRFQNKDGSLTSAGKKRRKQIDAVEKKEETVEERRTRLLKSTNPDELYKNRELLSTNEINERISRINAENTLASMAAKNKKTGMDYVNKIIAYTKKADELYQLTNTSLGKAIKKQIVGEEPKNYAVDYKKVSENMGKYSTDELQKMYRRSTVENQIKKMVSDMDTPVKETIVKNDTKAQVDDFLKSNQFTYVPIKELLEDEK